MKTYIVGDAVVTRDGFGDDTIVTVRKKKGDEDLTKASVVGSFGFSFGERVRLRVREDSPHEPLKAKVGDNAKP
jgi:hypothetical protein